MATPKNAPFTAVELSNVPLGVCRSIKADPEPNETPKLHLGLGCHLQAD